MFKNLFLTIALLFSTAATASIPKIDKTRTVMINGPIIGPSIIDLGRTMLKMAKKSNAPINIIINSPGGEVTVGYLFIDYMRHIKSAGVPINCYVQQIAASMAFQIYVACSNRYALSHSLLLWHGARVFLTEPIDEDNAKVLADELGVINARIKSELYAALGMPRFMIDKHFYRQTLHVAQDLEDDTTGFLETANSIPDLLEISPSTVPTTDAGIFGSASGYVYQKGN